MIFDPFDVVAVPFPFTDRQAFKRRPALVLSSNQFNRTHDQSILAMITSTTGSWPSDVTVDDWREAGLSFPCKVRFKLFTLDNSLVIRKIGSLSDKDSRVARRALSQHLGLG